jgi:glycosidase
MSTPKSVQCAVYKAIKSVIDVRINNSAISQNSKIIRLDSGSNSLLSWTLEGNGSKVFCYFNLGHKVEQVAIAGNLSVIAGKKSNDDIITLSALEFAWVGTTP